MSIFFRRHYEWLAVWCAETVDKGALDEEGVVWLMEALAKDNKQFKPEIFWKLYEKQPVTKR